MSWCDKLASTPSVGLRLDHRYKDSSDILNSISPILNKLVNGEKPTFSVNTQDVFGIDFSTDNGYHYGIDSARIFVEFQHRLKVEPVSGGAPIANLITTPLPYTKLLPEVIDRTIEATLLMTHDSSRKINRVGIVSTTFVEDSEAPPGIRRLIEYLGRPWNQEIDSFTYQIAAQTTVNDEFRDRCVYVLNRSEDPEQLLNIKFDWQRTFKNGQTISSENLRKIFNRAKDDALNYFEELAEGSNFDESVISARA